MKQKERPQVYNNPLSTTVRSGGSTKTGDLANEYRDHLSLGSKAPDFTLADLNGNDVTLSQFRGKSYVVLEFGSFT